MNMNLPRAFTIQICYAYKAIIYIFTNSVSGPFLECLVKYKDDYDNDWGSRGRGHMGRPRPLCQPVVHNIWESLSTMGGPVHMDPPDLVHQRIGGPCLQSASPRSQPTHIWLIWDTF